ncbi:MAG TPA: hypothetical protein VNV38_05950 [Stellaceae bacterium]|jgi:hypothetical protein|nr:hypothetical protein [Stellaceae bacterium]
MIYSRGAALALLVVGASAVPLHDASAWCRWRCGPPLIALPFVAAGAILAGAATVATAPIRAIAGPGYYGPPPGYYAPGYYAPPPAYYGYYGPPPGYQPGYNAPGLPAGATSNN